MRTFSLAVSSGLLLAALPSAAAQCRLSFLERGTGAVDRGCAILSDQEQGLAPHVHFFSKTRDGWRSEQVETVGDLEVVFYLPVAIDGDRAIAGSPESNDIAGQAVLFDRVGDRWVPRRLLSATIRSGDFFGSSVDVSGDTAIVGASHWGPDGNGDGLGRVHVFEFDGSAWNEVAQLTTYGDSIDVEGNTIAVGDDRVAPGRAQVYRKVAGVWTWIDEVQLLPPPPQGPILGTSVALHGDLLAVGAPGRSIDAVPGFVELFREGPFGWVSIQRIRPRAGFPGDQFGTSLAWSGSTLLVGAPAGGEFGGGAVHRFEYDGTRFVEAGAIRPEPGERWFGYRVALQAEDAVLTGSPSVSIYRLGFAERRSFCPATANSSGVPGALAIEGCDSCSGKRLTLEARDLPPAVLAVAFHGTETAAVPFGDGFRCGGGRLARFPAESADGAGSFAHAVDFDAPAARLLVPGSTRSFQVLYRDPRSAGSGMNLTNAVSIGITP